jgi:hypothetical protein
LVPSKVFSDPRPVVLIPFSLCRLPTGTTRLEFVTSGRSVAISDADVGHSPACTAVGKLRVVRRTASAQVPGLHLVLTVEASDLAMQTVRENRDQSAIGVAGAVGDQLVIRGEGERATND